MVISVHIIWVDDDMTQDDVGPGTGAHQHDNIDSDVVAAADASARIVDQGWDSFVHFSLKRGNSRLAQHSNGGFATLRISLTKLALIDKIDKTHCSPIWWDFKMEEYTKYILSIILNLLK